MLRPLALLTALALTTAGAPAPSAEARTAAYFAAIRHDPTKLVLFLEEMPKGGDLHHHLTGAVYAESYIDYAVEDGDCIDATFYDRRAAVCARTRRVSGPARDR